MASLLEVNEIVSLIVIPVYVANFRNERLALLVSPTRERGNTTHRRHTR